MEEYIDNISIYYCTCSKGYGHSWSRASPLPPCIHFFRASSRKKKKKNRTQIPPTNLPWLGKGNGNEGRLPLTEPWGPSNFFEYIILFIDDCFLFILGVLFSYIFGLKLESIFYDTKFEAIFWRKKNINTYNFLKKSHTLKNHFTYFVRSGPRKNQRRAPSPLGRPSEG